MWPAGCIVNLTISLCQHFQQFMSTEEFYVEYGPVVMARECAVGHF
jgi:hypothetical protein